jgi:hypothetical protein
LPDFRDLVPASSLSANPTVAHAVGARVMPPRAAPASRRSQERLEASRLCAALHYRERGETGKQPQVAIQVFLLFIFNYVFFVLNAIVQICYACR